MIGTGLELSQRIGRALRGKRDGGYTPIATEPKQIDTSSLPEQKEKKQVRILGKGLSANKIPSSDPCIKLLSRQLVWPGAKASFYDRLLISGWNVVGGKWNETPENPNQRGIYSVLGTEGVTNYILNIDDSVIVLHTPKDAVIAEKKVTPHLLTRVAEVVQETNANGKPGIVFYCYEVTIPPTADEIRSALATRSRTNID